MKVIVTKLPDKCGDCLFCKNAGCTLFAEFDNSPLYLDDGMLGIVALDGELYTRSRPDECELIDLPTALKGVEVNE